MIRALPAGRLFGVDVNIHPTFLLVFVLAFFYWGRGANGGLVPLLLGCVLIALVFISVLIHEFGHCFMARQFGIDVLDITLWPFSGVSRIEQMPASPRNELLIAIAGPAMNFAIFVALLPVIVMILILKGPSAIFSESELFRNLRPVSMVATIAILNLGLMLFNLLPAFPLDGGRMLRAAMSTRFGRQRATTLASRVGIAIAVVLILLGIVLHSVLIPMFGVFIVVAARAESIDVRVESQLRSLQVGQYALWDMGGVSPDDSLTFALRGGPRDVVVTRRGRVVGMLWRSHLLDGLHGGMPGRKVSDVMDTSVYVADVSESVYDVQQQMHRMQRWAVPVTERGMYRGIFTAERFISIHRQMKPGFEDREWGISEEWKDAFASSLRWIRRRR